MDVAPVKHARQGWGHQGPGVTKGVNISCLALTRTAVFPCNNGKWLIMNVVLWFKSNNEHDSRFFRQSERFSSIIRLGQCK